jgi:signal transduction histidine kinase
MSDSTPPTATPDADLSTIAAKLGIDATLLSNFTHQIINPLNGVVGTISGLIDGSVPQDKREQRLRAVRAQLSHAIELVRNLAFLAQLSTQEGIRSLRTDIPWTVLPDTIIQATLFFDELGKQKGITFHLKDRETQYMVPAHKDLLRQVFLNIAENDLKYSDDHTPVTIEVRAQKSTKDLLVEIESTGPGFENVERARLFDLGFRGEAAKALKASGSGLGLYLAKSILEIYGATIEAEYSPASRRTLFRIRFPRYRLDTVATEAFKRTHR